MKNTDKFYLECACSSHTVLFERYYDDGAVNISYMVNAFSFKQEGFIIRLWNKIKLIWFILWHGEALLYDIWIDDNKTINDLKKFFLEIKDVEDVK